MFDAGICAGMELGAPRVSASTLRDLHRLLLERGFRRSSHDDSHIVQEKPDDQAAKILVESTVAIGAAPADQHCVRVDSTSWNERPGALEDTPASCQSPHAGGGCRDQGGRR